MVAASDAEVGRIIGAAAAKSLKPVTLELVSPHNMRPILQGWDTRPEQHNESALRLSFLGRDALA